MVAITILGVLWGIVTQSLVTLSRVARGAEAAVAANAALVDAATRIERDTGVTARLAAAGSTQIEFHATTPGQICTDVVIANVGPNLVETTRACTGSGRASTVVLARGVTISWDTPVRADDGQGETEALIAWTATASSTRETLKGSALLRP